MEGEEVQADVGSGREKSVGTEHATDHQQENGQSPDAPPTAGTPSSYRHGWRLHLTTLGYVRYSFFPIPVKNSQTLLQFY